MKTQFSSGLSLFSAIALGALIFHHATQISMAQSAINPKAARSVHLGYQAPEGDVFTNEMTVEESVAGSYFMACGFGRGYFGIQELTDKRKIVLFSVWDPTAGDDPNAVEKHDQVEILGQGAGVEVSRFGGEGTGGKSLWNYDWKLGNTYRFLVAAKVEGEKTVFTGYFYIAEENRWQQMASFRTKTGGAPLKGLYSFVEDFRRDGKSAEQIRRARFGNGWLRNLNGDWIALKRARFTADGNTQMHINAGVSGDAFTLQNGGATVNITPLRTILERPLNGLDLPDAVK